MSTTAKRCTGKGFPQDAPFNNCPSNQTGGFTRRKDIPTKEAYNKSSMHEEASRLLAWVNKTLHTGYSHLRELDDGVSYALLVDILLPGGFPLHLLRLAAEPSAKVGNFCLLLETLEKQYQISTSLDPQLLAGGAVGKNAQAEKDDRVQYAHIRLLQLLFAAVTAKQQRKLQQQDLYEKDHNNKQRPEQLQDKQQQQGQPKTGDAKKKKEHQLLRTDTEVKQQNSQDALCVLQQKRCGGAEDFQPQTESQSSHHAEERSQRLHRWKKQEHHTHTLAMIQQQDTGKDHGAELCEVATFQPQFLQGVKKQRRQREGCQSSELLRRSSSRNDSIMSCSSHCSEEDESSNSIVEDFSPSSVAEKETFTERGRRREVKQEASAPPAEACASQAHLFRQRRDLAAGKTNEGGRSAGDGSPDERVSIRSKNEESDHRSSAVDFHSSTRHSELKSHAEGPKFFVTPVLAESAYGGGNTTGAAARSYNASKSAAAAGATEMTDVRRVFGDNGEIMQKHRQQPTETEREDKRMFDAGHDLLSIENHRDSLNEREVQREKESHEQHFYRKRCEGSGFESSTSSSTTCAELPLRSLAASSSLVFKPGNPKALTRQQLQQKEHQASDFAVVPARPREGVAALELKHASAGNLEGKKLHANAAVRDAAAAQKKAEAATDAATALCWESETDIATEKTTAAASSLGERAGPNTRFGAAGVTTAVASVDSSKQERREVVRRKAVLDDETQLLEEVAKPPNIKAIAAGRQVCHEGKSGTRTHHQVDLTEVNETPVAGWRIKDRRPASAAKMKRLFRVELKNSDPHKLNKERLHCQRCGVDDDGEASELEEEDGHLHRRAATSGNVHLVCTECTSRTGEGKETEKERMNAKQLKKTSEKIDFSRENLETAPEDESTKGELDEGSWLAEKKCNQHFSSFYAGEINELLAEEDRNDDQRQQQQVFNRLKNEISFSEAVRTPRGNKPDNGKTGFCRPKESDIIFDDVTDTDKIKKCSDVSNRKDAGGSQAQLRKATHASDSHCEEKVEEDEDANTVNMRRFADAKEQEDDAEEEKQREGRRARESRNGVKEDNVQISQGLALEKCRAAIKEMQLQVRQRLEKHEAFLADETHLLAERNFYFDKLQCLRKVLLQAHEHSEIGRDLLRILAAKPKDF